MNYNITGKHITLTDAMKESVIHALHESEKFYDKIIDVSVILTMDHRKFIAEAIMHIDGEKLFVKSEENDMYVAIADMGERLAHNLRRVKEKRNKVKHTSIRHIQEESDEY